MADNVAITAGAGTSVAADDIGSVFYQRVKLTWGVDGTASDANLTTPLPTQDAPATTGGVTLAGITSAASTNATSVKASAGQLYSVTATNNSTSARYLKFYNKASAPNPASDTPVLRIMIPASGGITADYSKGLVFGTGIAYAVVTGAGDTNTGAVGADECQINVGYK